jgi:hypothetical protein
MRGNQQREGSRRLMDGGTFIVEPATAPLGDARSSAFRMPAGCEHVSNNFFLFFGDFYLTIFLLSFFCFFRFGGIQLHG